MVRLLLLLPVMALAAAGSVSAGIGGIPSPATKFPSSGNLLGNLVSSFLLYAIAAAGLWFLANILIAGFNMITSLADPGKLAAAKDKLYHSLVGLLVVISAYFIARIAFELVLGIRIY